MEEAVAEKLKIGELMRKDVLQELEVIQSLSSKLLVFDLKRKHIESHFDSLVELIERKKDEAVEVIRSREEEAGKRAEEFRLREERLEQRAKQVEGQLKAKKAEIEKQRKEVERRAAECEVKEKELSKAKIVIERLCAELSEKEKEISGMKKAVDDLTMRIKEEDERRNAACQKLSDENLALQEEVNSLTQQLEVKKQLPEREELLPAIQKFLHIFSSAGIIKICNPIKHSELNGEDLFILVRDHVHDQETDTSNVSSLLLEAKDKAPELVLEALRISYLSESEEQNSRSMFSSCRILLLEQLGQICPQGISQARKEALKVAVEWSAQVKSCADKSVELSRFLQFLSMYGIASEFGDEVLVSYEAWVLGSGTVSSPRPRLRSDLRRVRGGYVSLPYPYNGYFGLVRYGSIRIRIRLGYLSTTLETPIDEIGNPIDEIKDPVERFTNPNRRNWKFTYLLNYRHLLLHLSVSSSTALFAIEASATLLQAVFIFFSI